MTECCHITHTVHIRYQMHNVFLYQNAKTQINCVMCIPRLQCPHNTHLQSFHQHHPRGSPIYGCLPTLYFLIKCVSPYGLSLSGSEHMFVCVCMCDGVHSTAAHSASRAHVRKAPWYPPPMTDDSRA